MSFCFLAMLSPPRVLMETDSRVGSVISKMGDSPSSTSLFFFSFVEMELIRWMSDSLCCVYVWFEISWLFIRVDISVTRGKILYW